MTTWDVYDVYNELVAPIIPSSVGRAIHSLKKVGAISYVASVDGDQGRPVNLYQLNDDLPDVIERRTTVTIPNAVKIDLLLTENGDIDVEKMIENLDLVLSKISRKFNLNY
jgi:predicted transcriptional regulator